ncbi:MAG: NifB/NifX family molybdenum-iron cluster-binding protein [Bacteroidetes bacterium]|nr:NifB/NifX family molybdenum-iron cluster-binding protein [Bacteroidota bacterium]
MKIAVPTRGEVVDSHFGHCEFYTIFNIDENKKIASCQTLPSPQGCGCKSNIAQVLEELGVTIMIAGSMGNGALIVLKKHNIEVYRGCEGKIIDVVNNFLSGGIKDSGEACSHTDDNHECSENH